MQRKDSTYLKFYWDPVGCLVGDYWQPVLMCGVPPPYWPPVQKIGAVSPPPSIHFFLCGARSKSWNQQNPHSSANFCLRALVAKHDFLISLKYACMQKNSPIWPHLAARFLKVCQYDQLRRNSCYGQLCRNSCSDQLHPNSCYNELVCNKTQCNNLVSCNITTKLAVTIY